MKDKIKWDVSRANDFLFTFQIKYCHSSIPNFYTQAENCSIHKGCKIGRY